MRRRSRNWRRSCIRWCARRKRNSWPRRRRRRQGGGARYSAAVRDRRRQALRRRGGGVGAGRKCSACAPSSGPGMNEEKFRAILAKQMPDAEKRARADFVVDSGQGFEHARAQVRDILRQVATMANQPMSRSGSARTARSRNPVNTVLSNWISGPTRYAASRNDKMKPCARSSSTPKPPASTRRRATAWSSSAASSWSTAFRPARLSTPTSIPSATCRRRPSPSTG